MAKYGARYIRWAPFAASNAEPDGALPSYGTAIGLSRLVKVTDNPTYAEGKLHGDDELAEYASEFVEADVDMEITELENEMASAIYGAKLETETEGGDLKYNKDDSAPYGGFGFVGMKMVNGIKSFIGVFYPKSKAVVQGEEFSTKGDSITFTSGKLKLKCTAAKTGDWKVVSKNMATFDAAKAWLDGKLDTPSSPK